MERKEVCAAAGGAVTGTNVKWKKGRSSEDSDSRCCGRADHDDRVTRVYLTGAMAWQTLWQTLRILVNTNSRGFRP